MEGARLEAKLEDGELGARGADSVTLVLAANAGLDPGPLAAVASGGELSRIALAIRIAARADGGPGCCCWTRSTPAWAAVRRGLSAAHWRGWRQAHSCW